MIQSAQFNEIVYTYVKAGNHTELVKGHKILEIQLHKKTYLSTETDEKILNICRLPMGHYVQYINKWCSSTYRDWFVSWDQSLHAAANWVSIFVNLE